jgi:hypothetical protein
MPGCWLLPMVGWRLHALHLWLPARGETEVATRYSWQPIYGSLLPAGVLECRESERDISWTSEGELEIDPYPFVYLCVYRHRDSDSSVSCLLFKHPQRSSQPQSNNVDNAVAIGPLLVL